MIILLFSFFSWFIYPTFYKFLYFGFSTFSSVSWYLTRKKSSCITWLLSLFYISNVKGKSFYTNDFPLPTGLIISAGIKKARGSRLFDACGNQLVINGKKKGSTSSLEKLPESRSMDLCPNSQESKPKSILKNRDLSLAPVSRGSMVKSQSFDKDSSHLNTTPKKVVNRSVSPNPTPRAHSPELVKGVNRKGRKDDFEERKDTKSKKVRQRKDREVVLTAESIHEQGDKVNNMVETKSKNFMKKLFLL